MTLFDTIREKSKLVSLIVKFQNSVAYPALFALICAISGTCGKQVYLPCFFLLTAFCIFAGLFSKDLKVFIVPCFLIYYALGFDVHDNFYAEQAPLPEFDYSVIPYLGVCAVLILIVLAFRLISGGFIKETLAKRGIFFWGILLLDAVLILGGIFSPDYGFDTLIFGAMIAAVLLVSYLLFLVIFSRSKDGIAYACKTLVCLGYLVLFQILTIAYRLHIHDNFIPDRGNDLLIINRQMLGLSWGYATIIGGVLVLPIVACIYLMRTRKYPVFSFISALLFWLTTVLIDTRNAIIMGAIVLLLGFILCCTGGKNKRINLITVLSTVLLAAIGIAVFIISFPDTYHSIIETLLEILRFDADISSSGGLTNFLSSRPIIWADGLRDFLSAPVFGVGFRYGYLSPADASAKLFDNMYHNVFIQFLASMGIVGVLIFVFHLKHIAQVTLRRFSAEKLILLMVPYSILIMSLVDNFFFYPNFILIYTAFLAASELYLEQARLKRLNNLKAPRKDGKPRVVFTYIEAGKGHIIPTNNVCDSFCAKYGDRVEVVKSKFFTETGDPRMEKTEKLFSRTVKQTNRSPILSVLCKIGNLIAGDALALFGVLRMSISGRKTNPLAVKHIEELDADVIYTAHWAIPFYVNQLKTPRPYTVCFCPDIYANGAFNVDCNRFLIPSDVGYKQICRNRMYAGGNVTQVPFPMRPEAEAYKGEEKRAEFRAKLGISPDEFVVVLCDGGYGVARLGKTARALLSSPVPMTVIAMCGTNKKLYESLCALTATAPKHVRLIPVDFTDKPLEYLVCADVFAGKSGANSIAEPAALGIPIIVTKCATYVETGIKNYYVKQIKGAKYIPSARLAAKRIFAFAKDPSSLDYYRNNLKNSKRLHYDADVSADILFEALREMYGDI